MLSQLAPGIGLADASGSFRGASFRLDNYSTAVGRRADVREYPLRNTPQAEDLGRKARRFSFTAYVLGPLWEQQRDALLNACEEDGAGTLIHPFHGEHEVVCETCTVSEGRSTGIRYASFELAFVEHGDYRAPDWEQDPAHTLLNQTQGGYRAAEAAF